MITAGSDTEPTLWANPHTWGHSPPSLLLVLGAAEERTVIHFQYLPVYPLFFSPFIHIISPHPVISSSSLLFYFLLILLSPQLPASLWLTLFLKFLKCPSSSHFLYHLIYSVLCHWLADNSTSRRLHHVWLTGERPGTQNPHAPLIPSDDAVLIHPSMYPAWCR